MVNLEKQRFLESLREYARAYTKPVIYQEELEFARETVSKFRCPIGLHPTYCDWSPCPNTESEEKCHECRKALWLIYKVEHGKVRVRYRTMAVEMP